jgi:hypothetical protein
MRLLISKTVVQIGATCLTAGALRRYKRRTHCLRWPLNQGALQLSLKRGYARDALADD